MLLNLLITKQYQAKMQDSYMSRYSKKNSQLLPYIHKKLKPIDATLSKLKQPTEQSLLLQLQDIDETLFNKNFAIRNGLLFSSEISDKLVTELHSCLKKKTIIMEQGFSLWNRDLSQEEGSNKEDKRLSTKLETLNERIVKLSFENVYEYDLRKYMQIMKMNRNKWSLFKRAQNQTPYSNASKVPLKLQRQKIQQSIDKQKNKKTPHQSASLQNSKSVNNNTSMVYQSHKTSKLSQLSESQITSKINETTQHRKRKMLTEIEQAGNPEDEYLQISKYDIKNMLKKQSHNLIFIWLPPATYPQFHGMFSYSITNKLTACRLKKYFFFRRGLTKRFFLSILQQISTRQQKYIESIQIITNKMDYGKIYEPIGWKMKSVQGMDKIRIKFERNQN